MAHRRVLVSSTAQFLKYAFNIGMSWSSTSRDTLAFLTEAARRSPAARPINRTAPVSSSNVPLTWVAEIPTRHTGAVIPALLPELDRLAEVSLLVAADTADSDDGFREGEEEEDGEDLREITAFLGGPGYLNLAALFDSPDRQGLASLTLIRLAVLTWAQLMMALRSPGSLAISLAGAAYFLGVVLTSLQACFASGDVVGAGSSAWFARDAVREREPRVTGLLRVAAGGAAGSPARDRWGFAASYWGIMLVVFTVAYAAWIGVEPLLENAVWMLVAAF
ncbi:hypothetical protein HK405_016094, partial [Cladochytrium tenue]